MAALLLIFAGHAAAQPPPTTLRLGMQLEPPNLDPTAGAAAAIDEAVTGNVFESLVRIGRDGQVAPALAESWEISPDGLIYLFHLRRNVRFHDGAPFDASVVKFSLDRARAENSANAQKAYFDPIDRVEILDPLTVRLVLKRPSSSLIYVLAWGDAAMVSPASVAHDDTNPIGTGPFRFAGWRRGESITLEANPAYWGAKPRTQRIVLKFIADPTAAFAAIRAGDLDAYPGFPAPENLPELAKDPRFRVVVGSTEGETILALNNARPPFNDIRVRRALAYAIDRKAIIDGAMFGYGQPIGSHYPPQNPGYVDLTGRYPHDVAKAKALLAEAGYASGLDVTLKLPPPSYARRSGEIIAAQLAAAGVRVRIENLEWAQWLDQVLKNHSFDMTIVSHTEPMDYDIYGRDYYFGYRSADFDALLKRLDAAVLPTERNAILGDIQRKLAEDSPNVFLFELPKLGVYDARLRGYWVDAPVQASEAVDLYFEGAGAAAGPAAAQAKAGGFWGWLALAGLGALVVAGVWKLGARYVAGRAVALGLTFLAATIIVFLLIQILPGDPAAYMMGLNANPQAVAALRSQMGLDQPATARYLAWLVGMLHGDLGTSYTYHVPVAGLIGERLQVSLALALIAMALSIAVALPIGILAAARRGKASDVVSMGLAQIGVALPNFWFAMLLVLVFSVGLRWLPSGGFPGWDAGLVPGLRALVLPAIALALPQAAILARVLRSALIETLGEDYVRTARAKGLSPTQALVRHALRNAMIPALTILGLQFPFLLAGSVIVENVFFLPGLGRLVFQAITQRDLIVVQGVVILLVFLVVAVTFLIDLGYAAIDPRLRTRRS
ncbi:ABC-type dipeptide/oligopeptide/nickel transport system permease component/ABC-type transport system substrate-binding protein [Caulobacter ginsengisoli]|uniref:ABC-type dipeptide/oligopeptide/nickel transport system permease component/ABC-type transport system substrate-binding protein n=1 Tax=Caulobacter ginsengisoli TaxID=400775 RepID=A0ABU0IRF9_9CAUL|nr:ABC transporter substrate-binding protein [Caulobacter ginsengisoli]MDQ0464598.1 ABC-type dipeptide/oligopeptide/nickel transport system permease component/ABC-type transport system substrate-binding protein [Caulobacter ginsengisoli]